MNPVMNGMATKDHDHAVGGEYLIIVVGVQVSLVAVEGDGLLNTHHDRVGEAAQKHDERQNDVHDADLFVIDRCEPFPPEITPQFVFRNQSHDGQATDNHGNKRAADDWIVRDRFPGEPPEDELSEC